MACSPSARGSRENGLLICIEESEPKKGERGWAVEGPYGNCTEVTELHMPTTKYSTVLTVPCTV